MTENYLIIFSISDGNIIRAKNESILFKKALYECAVDKIMTVINTYDLFFTVSLEDNNIRMWRLFYNNDFDKDDTEKVCEIEENNNHGSTTNSS